MKLITIICKSHDISYYDGLGQDCSNSLANALELLESCTKPSISNMECDVLVVLLNVLRLWNDLIGNYHIAVYLLPCQSSTTQIYNIAQYMFLPLKYWKALGDLIVISNTVVQHYWCAIILAMGKIIWGI